MIIDYTQLKNKRKETKTTQRDNFENKLENIVELNVKYIEYEWI